MGTGVELIFKIAAIGIVTAVLHQLLRSSQKEEMAIMTSIGGIIVILFIIVHEISDLFGTIQTLFGL